MSESIYLIYKHTSPSGKSYIGQTNNYIRRCNDHKFRGGCVAFSRAIEKYGWEAFTHEILAENLTVDEANRLEEYYILDLNTLSPNGYNLRTGGCNSTFSDDIKQLLSDLKKGKPRSDEVKLKISNKLKGRKCTWNVRGLYGRRVICNGITYNSITLLSNALGRSVSSTRRMALSTAEKYNYIYFPD